MKWQEVGYTLNGWWCSVIFDTRHDPGVLTRYDGIIECDIIGGLALLKNPYTNGIMTPPPWATVVIHTPTRLETIWY